MTGKRKIQISILGPVFIIALFLTLSVSCERDYMVPLRVELPDSASFSNDILPIFEKSCATSGCHNSGGIAPVLTPETAYDNLFLLGYVDTTSVEESILYQRMSASSSPMPPSGKLPQDKVDLVKLWIEQNAPNN